MSVQVTPALEYLTWDQAVLRMDRRQGEHVTMVGPTGSGKTEVMAKLLEHDRYWVAFSTKRKDSTLDQLRPMRPATIRRGRDLNVEVARRFILAPKWHRRMPASAQNALHAQEFSDALNEAFWSTGWTVAIDEGEYIYRHLKVTDPIDRQLTQGRSQGNTVIMGTQRPRYVTLHAYEQATHLLIFKMSDLANVSRAAELAGVNRAAVLEHIYALNRHDVLYVNTITGDMFTTNTRKGD